MTEEGNEENYFGIETSCFDRDYHPSHSTSTGRETNKIPDEAVSRIYYSRTVEPNGICGVHPDPPFRIEEFVPSSCQES